MFNINGDLFSQNSEEVKQEVKSNPSLKDGGVAFIDMNSIPCLIVVSNVIVGTKSIPQLQRIGKVKADRDALAFINGEEITSSIKSFISEETIVENRETSYKSVDYYEETILSNVTGFINGMTPGGYWFSEDKSVYYYISYKLIK